MTQEHMTPAQRAAQANTYAETAHYMRQNAKETRDSQLPFGHADADVVNAALEQVARQYDNLAVYFDGKAQGMRQEL